MHTSVTTHAPVVLEQASQEFVEATAKSLRPGPSASCRHRAATDMWWVSELCERSGIRRVSDGI